MNLKFNLKNKKIIGMGMLSTLLTIIIAIIIIKLIILYYVIVKS